MFLYSWIIDSLKLQFYKGTVVPFGIHTIQKTCNFLSENKLCPYNFTHLCLGILSTQSGTFG